MATRIRLGELLVRAGVLDDYKLKAALAEQKKWGGRLGKILVEMNFVSEDLLVKALSKQLGIKRATFQNMNVPHEILTRVNISYARANAFCPEHFDPDHRVLTVAMADPTNMRVVDDLRFKTGLKVEATIASERQVIKAIDHILGGVPASGGFDLSGDLESSSGFGNRYQAAMAASGIPTDMSPPPADPGALRRPSGPGGPPPPIAPSVPPARTEPMAPIGGWGGPPRQGLFDDLTSQPLISAPPSNSAPVPQTSQGLTPPRGAGSALDLAERLDGAQRQQLKALRVMLELLIEKGVFSRDEYMQLVNRR